ncbi:TPA: HDOD domain-containing protein [Burkholderia lata]
MNKLDIIFDEAVKLPAISQVVTDLFEMTKDGDANLHDVIEKVREDQLLSAKAISTANSSYFMKPNKIASVEQAVTLIGISMLHVMVITSGVTRAFPKVPHMPMAKYWRHVLTSSFMAIEMAKRAGAEQEEAFTAALMQGLGILLMHVRLPSDAKKVVKIVDPLDFEGRIPVEAEILGVSHNEVTAELLSRWHFPERIQKVIFAYPNPQSDDLLGKILFASSQYSWGRMSGLLEGTMSDALTEKFGSNMGFDEAWFKGKRDHVNQRVDSILNT